MRDSRIFNEELSTLQNGINRLEERKHGNDVEMMSIGSQMRLDHLEEQPLRQKKTNGQGSSQKPPKITKKITMPSATTMANTTNMSLSSGTDDS